MFATIRVRSWNQAKDIAAGRALWVFRGHADQSWPPETSLFRLGQLQKLRHVDSTESLHLREAWALHHFKRFAHHYVRDLPPDEATLDWLALVQHYGGPTRLLDFTHSFYIAAFFALENASVDSAVWAVDYAALSDAASERLKFNNFGLITDTQNANNQRLIESIRDNKMDTAVLPAEPLKTHERLWIQQGIFLAPTNPTKPFLDNLAETFGMTGKVFGNPAVVAWSSQLRRRTFGEYGDKGLISVMKLVIPLQFHHEALEDLSNMNITAATLFPGLDGFARSLKFHI